MQLRDGRAFSDSDTATSERVAIVNESFARQILHDPHPVGRMLGSGKTTTRIVGVSQRCADEAGP